MSSAAEREKAAKIGRPTDEAKRDAILDAASRLFFDVGFAATALEQVASKAGVSKVTVYNHFGDKRGLFIAAVDRECDQVRAFLTLDMDTGGDLHERMLAIGTVMTDFLARPEMMRFELRIAAETEHTPEVGQSFLDAGPRRMRAAFVELLRAEVEAGRLAIDDLPLAAEQFVAMCRGFADLERKFGAGNDAERNRERIEGAVDVFLKAYGRSH